MHGRSGFRDHLTQHHGASVFDLAVVNVQIQPGEVTGCGVSEIRCLARIGR